MDLLSDVSFFGHHTRCEKILFKPLQPGVAYLYPQKTPGFNRLKQSHVK